MFSDVVIFALPTPTESVRFSHVWSPGTFSSCTKPFRLFDAKKYWFSRHAPVSVGIYLHIAIVKKRQERIYWTAYTKQCGMVIPIREENNLSTHIPSGGKKGGSRDWPPRKACYISAHMDCKCLIPYTWKWIHESLEPVSDGRCNCRCTESGSASATPREFRQSKRTMSCDPPWFA